jgi:hypothetical protein
MLAEAEANLENLAVRCRRDYSRRAPTSRSVAAACPSHESVSQTLPVETIRMGDCAIAAIGGEPINRSVST